MRNFFKNFVHALDFARTFCFMVLGKLVVPAAIRTSIAIGTRPQNLAYVFLAASVLLDGFNEARYASNPGLNFGWGASVTLHVAVIIFSIETVRRFLQRLERTGEVKATMLFGMALDLSRTWTLLMVFNVMVALIGIAMEGSMWMTLQAVENTLDLLAIGFGWTLMTKPPSLWSRLKDRAKDWKPTFAPVPQGA